MQYNVQKTGLNQDQVKQAQHLSLLGLEWLTCHKLLKVLNKSNAMELFCDYLLSAMAPTEVKKIIKKK